MRVFWFLATVLVALGAPNPLLGQWPGEVRGFVRDAVTDSPIIGAVVGIEGGGQTLTDPSGRYLLDGLAPGRSTLTVLAPGYLPHSSDHLVRNGRAERLDVALFPRPFELESVEASVQRTDSPLGTAHAIERAQILASGARTLGDAVRQLPGVVVVDRGAGSAQTLSIRGSDADAVLVLVDGVPLNDPVTGVADLSRISAEIVRTARLHTGASSSRFGPRAGAGVLEVETGRSMDGFAGHVGSGSLGSHDVGLDKSFASNAWALGANLGHSEVGGGFAFELPTEVGGGNRTRRNADRRLTSLLLRADRAGNTYARLRLGGEVLDRGLPGPGFGPSLSARQEAWGVRASLNTGRTMGNRTVRSVAYVRHARRRFLDRAPPAGLPYDEDSRLSEASIDLTAQRSGSGRFTSSTIGLVSRTQWIEADALETPPGSNTDVGASVSTAIATGVQDIRVIGQLRLDRAGRQDHVQLSHAVTVAWGRGHLSLELAHRSSFSPPTLADQFFREGVGTRANPDLRAERIPSEFEFSGRFEGASVEGGGSAYVGDVRDRIVWQPDFRFVWSPTNTNVRRRGADAWLAVRPAEALALRGSYGFARTTYDREGPADSVQLAYRPRHTGSLGGEWTNPVWGFGTTAYFTGKRFPVPSPINALPSFWSVDVSVSHTWTRPSWSSEVSLRVRRVLDARDTLIFGFPDPGRTFALNVRVRR